LRERDPRGVRGTPTLRRNCLEHPIKEMGMVRAEDLYFFATCLFRGVWLDGGRLCRRCIEGVGSVGGRSVVFRRSVRVDSELVHSGNKGGPFEAEARSSAISSSHTAFRLFESLKDLLAIDFRDNAADRPTPGRCCTFVLSEWYRCRASLYLRERHH